MASAPSALYSAATRKTLRQSKWIAIHTWLTWPSAMPSGQLITSRPMAVASSLPENQSAVIFVR